MFISIYAKISSAMTIFDIFWVMLFSESLQESRVAQWKRAGPITQRSVDRNYALLVDFFNFVHSDWICQSGALCCCLLAALVPLAQRIARWTSNPKVLGSIPRWDEYSVR